MTATIDTHRIVKRLRDAGASEQLAETWTDILREGRELDLSQLATKADVAALKADLEVRLAELRGDLRREIADAKFDTIKWVVGFGIVQLGALLGVAYAILRLFPGSHP